MSNVIAILNQKGGSGKTTLATHLAQALKAQGGSVAILDTDPQASAQVWDAANKEGSQFLIVGIQKAETLAKNVVQLSADWIIVDGAGTLNAMAAAAIRVAQLVIIPCQPSPLDIWAASEVVQMVKDRQALTGGSPVAAFQVTRAKKGTQFAREVFDAIKEYELPMFHGAIHDRIEFSRAMAKGETVLETEPNGHGAWEINHLLKQILEAFE